MLQFKRHLPKLVLDKNAFLDKVDNFMNDTLAEGVRVWLRRFLAEGIPVETGMAKANLIPIGRFLHIAIPINPTRRSYYNKREQSDMTVEAGQQKSKFLFIADKKNLEYSFEWETETLHYFLRRYYNGAATPGEFAIEIAGEAFDTYVLNQLAEKFPDMLLFMEFEE